MESTLIIRIKGGLYRENDRSNIMFLRDGRKTTIITRSRNAVDGGINYHFAIKLLHSSDKPAALQPRRSARMVVPNPKYLN
uniref:Uncharacterized protein n=1 Tax=Salix viminalis TaxID=40686 RepID=A0A6N2KB85_SALVM